MSDDPNVFQNSDLEEFASHLGLDGSDADLFYESYYNLNIEDWDWDEDEHREEDRYSNY